MRLLYIFIATLCISISSTGQVASRDIQPYDFDTTLKGGFAIAYKVDDSLQYLFLKKGDKTIAELSSTSRGLLHKNLGYVGADFKNYFILVHSFGSGNSHYIELIKKTTGKNILKEGAAWIDVDRAKGVVLYSDNDVPTANDKMTLYFVKTGRRQRFSFPHDIFGAPEILNRMKIDKLTEKHLIIKYYTERGSRTKVYRR